MILELSSLQAKALGYHLDDGLVYGWNRRFCFQFYYPLRFSFGNGKVAVKNALVKCAALLFEPVLVMLAVPSLFPIAAARTLDAVLQVRQHQEGQVRFQVTAKSVVQLQNNIASQ